MFKIPTMLLRGLIFAILKIVTVAGLIFTEEPLDIYAAEGSSIWWPCNVQGDTPISYNWRYGDMLFRQDADGLDYKVFSNGTLYLADVSSGDVGDYTCEAENQREYIVSGVVQLNLAYISTVFANEPSSVTAHVGDELSLECEIESVPPPFFSWQRDGRDVVPDEYLVISSTGMRSLLVITKSKYTHQGQYRCIAANPLMPHKLVFSNLASVILEGKPGFLIEPSPLVVPQATDAFFHCIVAGHPTPLVQWYDSRDVSKQVQIQTSDRYTTFTNGSLRISKVGNDDIGYYTCKATNSWGENSASVLLTVTDPITIPLFTYVSADHIASEGDTVTLHCEATGVPPPRIEWYRDLPPEPMPSHTVVPGLGLLRLYKVTHEDSGFYTCEASNAEGSTSRRVRLDVQVPPRFTVNPQSISGSLGDTLQLRCRVDGFPKPSIVWNTPDGAFHVPTDNVNGISVLMDGTLIVHDLAVHHDGTFICVASNSVSTVTASATITVLVPPAIVKPPVSQRVIEGATVSFNCGTVGKPQPVVTWYTNGSSLPLRNSERHELYSSGTLKIKYTMVADKGQYKCVAENRLGRTESFAILVVLVEPKFIERVKNVIVDPGDMVSLKCAADRGDPTPAYHWLKDGKQLILESNMAINPLNSLIVHGVIRSNIGEYTCIAQNEAGAAKKTYYLSTPDVPVFVKLPQNTTVNITSSAVISCEAAARKQPQINWYFQQANAEIYLGSDRSTDVIGNRFITEDGWLHVTEVTEENSGWYTCEAFTRQKTVRAKAYLTVQVAPMISSAVLPPRVFNGARANITCNIESVPLPSVTWISPSGLVLTSHSSSKRYTLSEMSLVIRDARVKEDWGHWICIGCNLLGCINSSVHLSVEGSPAIVNVTASKQNDIISIQCIAVGTPKPTVGYRLNNKAFDNVNNKLAGHTISVDGGLTLKNVNISMSDVYTCIVENEHGSTGKKLQIPDKPYSPYVTDVLPHSAVLMWQRGGRRDLPIESYTVQLQIGLSHQWRELNRTIRGPPVDIIGLQPYTLYRFRVRANSVLGSSEFSEVDQVRTLESAPAAPSGVTVMSSRDSVVLMWDHPRVLNGNPDNIMYEIKYEDLTLDSPEGVIEMMYHDHLREVHIRDVPYNSTYQFMIRAINVNIDATSPWIFINATAKEHPPNFIPAIESLEPRGPHTVYISWNQIPKSHLMQGFAIAFSQEEEGDYAIIQMPEGNATGFELSGLEEGVTYYIKVAVYNLGGIGPYSAPWTIQTDYEVFRQKTYSAPLAKGAVIATIGGIVGGLLLLVVIAVICIQQRKLPPLDSVNLLRSGIIHENFSNTSFLYDSISIGSVKHQGNNTRSYNVTGMATQSGNPQYGNNFIFRENPLMGLDCSLNAPSLSDKTDRVAKDDNSECDSKQPEIYSELSTHSPTIVSKTSKLGQPVVKSRVSLDGSGIAGSSMVPSVKREKAKNIYVYDGSPSGSLSKVLPTDRTSPFFHGSASVDSENQASWSKRSAPRSLSEAMTEKAHLSHPDEQVLNVNDLVTHYENIGKSPEPVTTSESALPSSHQMTKHGSYGHQQSNDCDILFSKKFSNRDPGRRVRKENVDASHVVATESLDKALKEIEKGEYVSYDSCDSDIASDKESEGNVIPGRSDDRDDHIEYRRHKALDTISSTLPIPKPRKPKEQPGGSMDDLKRSNSDDNRRWKAGRDKYAKYGIHHAPFTYGDTPPLTSHSKGDASVKL